MTPIFFHKPWEKSPPSVVSFLFWTVINENSIKRRFHVTWPKRQLIETPLDRKIIWPKISDGCSKNHLLEKTRERVRNVYINIFYSQQSKVTKLQNQTVGHVFQKFDIVPRRISFNDSLFAIFHRNPNTTRLMDFFASSNICIVGFNTFVKLL